MKIKRKGLVYRRLVLGISQYALAQSTGIARWKIQLIESGMRQPSSEEKKLLSKVLRAKTSSLFPSLGAEL